MIYLKQINEVGDYILKILHVIGRLGIGGDTNIVLQLIDMMEKKYPESLGWQIDFITHDIGYDKECVNKLKQKGHNVFILKGDLRKLGLVSYISAMNKLLKENTYDIIQVHTGLQSGIVLFCAKKAGIKIRICHSHINSIQRKANLLIKFFAEKILKLFIKRYSNVKIACSEEAGKYLFGNEKFNLVYNGINLSEYANVKNEDIEKLKKELNICNKYIVGQIGSFADIKNQKFTLELAKRLKDNKDIAFVFVGDGENFKKIKDDAKKYNLNTIFVGKTKEIPKFTRMIDLLLLPSLLGEGFPLTLIEAQASGCPCLVSEYVTKSVDIGMKLLEYHSIQDINFWKEKIQKKKSKEIWSPKYLDKIIEKEMNIDCMVQKIYNIYTK